MASSVDVASVDSVRAGASRPPALRLEPVEAWIARLVHALIAGPGVEGGLAR